MANALTFIDTFNKIENLLKEEQHSDHYQTFSHKVKTSDNRAVQRFRDDLLSFSELRNAIVHNPRIDNKPIAEPHDDIVKRIQQIYEEISNPERVFPKFQGDVFGARKDEYINNVLSVINQKAYSQFPVFDDAGHVTEMVTTNTITRWLSSHLEEHGAVIVEETIVADFLPAIEYPDNYDFINRQATVYDAYAYFLDHMEKTKSNLDALLITENGKATEKLLGIITVSDIARWLSDRSFMHD